MIAFSFFLFSHIIQLTPQQQSAEPRNSAGLIRVQGPPKQDPSPTTLYDDLFEKAWHGAQVSR